MSLEQKDKYWNAILQKIKEGKCILIMGPDIAVPDAGKSMNELLKEHLETQADNGLIKYYPEDGFFSFAEPDAALFYNIQEFYEKLKPNDIHYKIAKIPFHYIISVSPDHLLRHVRDEKKVDYSFVFYNK
jgi:hypothetical protein